MARLAFLIKIDSYLHIIITIVHHLVNRNRKELESDRVGKYRITILLLFYRVM